MPSITRYRYLKPEVRPTEDPKKFIDNAIEFIHKCIKTYPVSERVELLASGGVDSSVDAALFNLAIGDKLYITHIDTGFMRLINGEEESKLVAQRFSNIENFEVTNARPLFYGAVFGESDAEKKRIKFRDNAYRIVADQQIVRHRVNTLTDGTILPDIKETPIVKTQHNVDVPYNSVKKEIQPLAGLYKNEVRILAGYLYETYGFKFLRSVQDRQPLPGPGLMVRTVGSIDLKKLNTEKMANDIVERIIDSYVYSIYGKRMYIHPETGEQIPFQSFAATFDNKFIETPVYKLLGTKVTGIKDGKRVYNYAVCIEKPMENLIDNGRRIPAITGFSRVLYKIGDGKEDASYVVAVRSVRSIDAVTAYPFELPENVLKNIGRQIIDKLPDVAAVYFDVSPKLTYENFTSATIEYE